MKSRLGMVLWAMCIGMSPLALAAQEEDLPFSKESLFDLAPPAGDEATPPSTQDAELPTSMDALFSLDPVEEKQAGDATRKTEEALPASKDDLFGTAAAPAPAPTPVIASKPANPWRGYFQTEFARTYSNPSHWSKVLGRLELGKQGRLDNGMKWKVSGRLDYNAAHDLDHYPKPVRDDERANFQLRETYLDIPAGDWDYRLGRQHVVWGEMVGLFFADVVSAKELRDFILPDFNIQRIPQWAARAEYFQDDFHAELLWIPFPEVNRIGKPGSEFYAYPYGPPLPIDREKKPSVRFENGNFGVRVSQLRNGWDYSGFVYRSTDSMATFYRDLAAGVYRPRHGRIWQAGGTLAKDLVSFVLKGEAVYTKGRRYNVLTIADPDGVVQLDTLDWAVGLDFNPDTDTRLNVQLFQRIYLDHDPSIVSDRYENGASLLVNRKFARHWEAEALLIGSLNRSDWLLRPKLAWKFSPDWRLNLGLDVFHGPPTGLFGQYDPRDRGYTELRYDF